MYTTDSNTVKVHGLNVFKIFFNTSGLSIVFFNDDETVKEN